MTDNGKLPFGGGSGAGVKISPVAFLIVRESNVKLLSIEANSPLDKLVDIAPDVINKAIDMAEKSFNKTKPIIQIEDKK